jgi:hypothetical protein
MLGAEPLAANILPVGRKGKPFRTSMGQAQEFVSPAIVNKLPALPPLRASKSFNARGIATRSQYFKQAPTRFWIVDLGLKRENHPVSEALPPLLRKEGSFASLTVASMGQAPKPYAKPKPGTSIYPFLAPAETSFAADSN